MVPKGNRIPQIMIWDRITYLTKAMLTHWKLSFYKAAYTW